MTQIADAGQRVPATAKLLTPSGLEEIIATFGDINDYIQPDGTLDAQWAANFLEYVALPVPLMLSFDHTKTINPFSLSQTAGRQTGGGFRRD